MWVRWAGAKRWGHQLKGVPRPHTTKQGAVQAATYLLQSVHLLILLLLSHHCQTQQRQDLLYTTMKDGSRESLVSSTPCVLICWCMGLLP
jgi:hypothetical protein